MKKYAFLIMLFLLLGTINSKAQDRNGEPKPPVIDMYILDYDGEGFATLEDALYTIDLTYYSAAERLGDERFSGSIPLPSYVELNLTEGDNQVPASFYSAPLFWDNVDRIHAKGSVDDGSKVREFEMDYDVRDVINAINARRTEAIHTFIYDESYLCSFENLINPMAGMTNDFAVMKKSTDGSGQDKIGRFDIDAMYDLLLRRTVFNDVEVPVLEVMEAEVPRAIGIGGSREKVENWINFFINKAAADVHNGVAVTMEDMFERTEPHPMAAIYGDNSINEMGTGVFGKGETTGVYGQGKNGTIGVTTGDQNGSAATAFVGAAPAAGGFKYGLYSNSNSHPGTWAAGIFGSGFYTGSWMMSSDEQLKTHITPQADALNKIMGLKPATYKYRSGTPYSFTDKIHHGFLAQDVEEIFPELVENIKMPTDPTPEKMASSPVVEFKGIDYTGMISILTGAIQELNTSLTAKIAEQAAEIEELRKLIKE